MEQERERFVGEMGEYASFYQELLNMDIEEDFGVLQALVKSLEELIQENKCLNQDTKMYEDFISTMVEACSVDENQPEIPPIQDDFEDQELDESIDDFINFCHENQTYNQP